MTQSRAGADVHRPDIEPASTDDREAEARLAAWFRGYGSALIGFSGGVDSAYLACVAVDAVGAERVLMASSFQELMT